MNKLRDAIVYLLENHPEGYRLSPTRLLALVFLADWRSAIQYGRQITEVNWQFDDFPEIVEDQSARHVTPIHGVPGSGKSWIRSEYGREAWRHWTLRKLEPSSLEEDDKEVLDFVIDATIGQSLQEFARLVKSTYPAVTQPRHESLDLVHLARKYKNYGDLLELEPEEVLIR